MRRMNVKVMGARIGCGWSETARRWLLARCGAAVASCPMQRGGGVLPVASVSSVVECIAHGWRGLGGVKVSEMSSKMCESRTNVEKCSELAWIVEEVLLGHF